MSEEQLKAFLEKVQGDTSLQVKLNAARSNEAALDIAKDAGFAITAEDIQSKQSATAELSDEELESAAGGYGRCFDHRGPVIVNTGAVCIKPTPSIKPLPLC
ncbi:Nif11-like leader peptide family natural product precursor [Synechococcus sp. A15-60]|uniref:Nif11-like leader peptide family natural product precursor n=1 Tax=Synechococcus sp. A15-60 TaxID=1050655 RepID=UPI00164617CE|nr:Nif11-like leader peptide family natural product precursor [Synechococcus sp. A15-60]QNI49588.1 nif11-like leader peptide domain protein [Synechococcus sp. A15-60]